MSRTNKNTTKKLTNVGMALNTKSDSTKEVAVWQRGTTGERVALTIREAKVLRRFLNTVLSE